MVSKRSTHKKVLKDSLLDGCQLWLDILCKDSVNSVSTKYSRMCTEMLLERMSQSTEPLDSPSHQPALNSLLIFFFAHLRP